jgi:hypothetical protein
MTSLLDRIRRNIFHREEKVFEIEEDLDCEVTDEIEKTLLYIKEAMDIPTEEIELSVESRRRFKYKQ